MGTIQTRKGREGRSVYRAMVRMRGYPHQWKTFERKIDAKDWIRRTEQLIKDGNVPSVEAERTTLYEALERYLREVTPGKKGARREQDRIKAWQRHPLAQRFLSHLRGAEFAAYRDKRREEGVADQTIRLELATISHIYTVAAKDWGMHGLRNPIKSMTLPSGSKERDRRLEGDEGERLLAALAKEGVYMAPIASFAIETAMRQGEILSLAWADVDLQARVAKLADTKNSEPRGVALSPKAIEILKGLPRSLEPDARAFPVRQDVLIRAFRRACTAAGIENFKFHDLRHEGVSRLFEKGLNVAEVASISGHRTWSQLRRYTQLKAEDLARKLA